jgi:radical SAM superfamily enzyme YgiQ (UPF0313 family)
MSWALQRKYRDLLDREEGYQRKAWGNVLTVCLAYPNHYRTGMSNLGFQTIYGLINRRQSFLCERVFLPDPADMAAFEGTSAPLFSLESQKPLAEFDIVAFSLPFENDYPHILTMLQMGMIPLLSAERGQRDPLVLGGGIAVTLNPEPLADFFDCFILGEGEETLPSFLSLFEHSRRCGLARKELLACVQKNVPAAYVPGCYEITYKNNRIENRRPVDSSFPERITSGSVKDINAFVTEQSIMTADTEFGDMFLVEVSRGCRRGCRFCAAGFVYRPARFRHRACLEPALKGGMERGKKIGLMGTAVSDHPELMSLCRSVTERKGMVAIASLRMDRVNGEMVCLLKDAGVETVSLAPEAGSERLRTVIRKGITEDHIFRAVELLAEYGIVNIRLYFMVGLPTETDEDIEAIIRLVFNIKLQGGRKKRPFRLITLSINQFIPKPATPFQWHPLADLKTVRKRIQRIERALGKEKSVKVIHDTPRQNYIQALLSLGDRRLGRILLAVHENGGNWSQALKEAEVDPDFTVYRPKGTDEVLPWDFIDHGAKKSFLKREYEQSLRIPPKG